MDSNFGNFANFSFDRILQFGNLSPAVSKHVSNVYRQLTIGFGFAVAGAIGTLYRILPIGYEVAALLTLASMLGVMFSNSKQYKTLAFCSYTFFQGITLGYFSSAIGIDVVLHALVGTLVIFGCFTASALTAPSRSYLYLGGILGSAISIMFWNNLIVNSLLGYDTMAFEVYFGLLVFCGYVLFDTQLMIYKAEQGIYDVVGDALGLWIDAVAIFVRIAKIMNDKKEKKKKKN